VTIIDKSKCRKNTGSGRSLKKGRSSKYVIERQVETFGLQMEKGIKNKAGDLARTKQVARGHFPTSEEVGGAGGGWLGYNPKRQGAGG